MKKTILSTAILFALGAPMAAFAGNDDIDIDSNDDTDIDAMGAEASGLNSAASESLQNVGNISKSGSHNATLSQSLNDVNSDNVTTIDEDGIVAHANELDQAIATADSTLSVRNNEVVMEGAINDASDTSTVTVSASNITRMEANAMTGSFINYGGIATTGQNLGAATAVAQSVVIQSNGGI